MALFALLRGRHRSKGDVLRGWSLEHPYTSPSLCVVCGYVAADDDDDVCMCTYVCEDDDDDDNLYNFHYISFFFFQWCPAYLFFDVMISLCN